MIERGGYTPPEAKPNTQLIPNYSSFFEEPILPPSEQGIKLTPEQFQEQFPVRFAIWQNLQDTMTDQPEADTSIGYLQAYSTRLHILNQLDRYISEHNANESTRTLRGRQVNVFEDIRTHLEKGGTEGYIKLPTGTGKTILFTELTEATDLRTLVVVPRQNLVEQTAERFSEFAPDMEVGRIYAHAKEHGRQVEITTYESLQIGRDNGTINPHDYDLLILDEAHKSLTPLRERVVQEFTNAIKLGFTATPTYNPEKQVSNLLGTEIHTMTIREAVEERMLSPFSVYVARTNTDISNVTIATNGDYNQAELEKAINNKERNLAAVQVYEQLMRDPRNHNQLSIAYCAGIQHAEDLAFEFQRIGVKAAAIHSDLTIDEKRQILEDYENGEIEVLCNAQMLIEGFDSKPTGIIINATPTASVVNAEQRGGRGLRLDENNPEKHAIIVDIIDQTSNRQFMPVLFAQIANGAYIYPPHQTTESSERHDIISAPPIIVEGLEVITNPEEVMRLVHEIEEIREENTIPEFSNPPDGWMIIGNQGYKDTIPTILDKSVNWVKRTVEKILDEVAEEQKDLPEEDKDILFGVFKNKHGSLSIHYSPLVIQRLQEYARGFSPAPDGWYTIGANKKSLGTLSHKIQRDPSWIKARINEIIQEITEEEDSNEISDDQRKPQMGEYLAPNGSRQTFYSDEVMRRLLDKSNEYDYPPEGWLTIGSERISESLSGLLRRSAPWIKKRIDSIIEELNAEKDKKGEQRQKLIATYRNTDGKSNTFYAPAVMDKLVHIASQETTAPSGWKSIGDVKAKDTLSAILQKTRPWITKRLPQVIKEIEEERDKNEVPDDQREPLFQEYHSENGFNIYYSPQVVERLVELASNELKPQENWFVLEQISNKNHPLYFGKSKTWVRTRIDKVIDKLRQEYPDQFTEESVCGKFVAENGRLTTFYHPTILERLIEMAQNEK